MKRRNTELFALVGLAAIVCTACGTTPQQGTQAAANTAAQGGKAAAVADAQAAPVNTPGEAAGSETATPADAAAQAPTEPAAAAGGGSAPATPEAQAAATAPPAPAQAATPADAAAAAPQPAAPSEPPAQQAAAPAQEAKPAAAPAPTTEEIQNAMMRFTKHPRVLFQSSKGSYQYYVGGVLSAEYDPQNSTLRISPDQRTQSGPVCEYTQDGRLKLTGKGKAQLETVATCNKLMNELTGFLR